MTNRTQKDLLSDFKNEICLNITILGKLQPMTEELSMLLHKENALEKPTQQLFVHLSHYLVSIVDIQASASLPWPLYDTQSERLYRNSLTNFVSEYSNRGLLSPVMSSYLVNPGCYKVIMLIFQLSTLSVQKLLVNKMNTDRHKDLYKNITEKYKSNKTVDFLKEIEKEIQHILCKFSKYLRKHKIMVHIAEILRNKIKTMEEKLKSTNVDKYIDNLVETFIKQQSLDDAMKAEIRKIKNVSEPSEILHTWLTAVDAQMDEIECKWKNKMEPFLRLCENTHNSTQELINRHTGETDKSLYMIEYNPKSDEIYTKDLQNYVNVEQSFVLKNIVKDGRLSFPYLIRGFLVAICFILKNTDIEEDIHTFNEYLENGRSNYNELASSMRILLGIVAKGEAKLKPSPEVFNKHYKLKHHLSITAVPDLSDLKSNRMTYNQFIFDSFTPLNTSKHQFNLLRKKNSSFIRPQPMFTTPFHHIHRDVFSKSILSCKISLHNPQNQNFHNMSMVPLSNRVNETMCEYSTGFTKQQIQRLLSTKKGSTSKKSKYNTQRPHVNIKKGLFNVSNNLNENSVLFRSHSSPNLYENREKHPFSNLEKRKLSIMQEDFASLLEVSGIVALSTDISCEMPKSLETTARIDATSLPLITISPDPSTSNILVNIENHINGDCAMPERSLPKIDDIKTETPKNKAELKKNTSSLEKIINRFKKVKANALSSNEGGRNEITAIIEEKENKTDNVDVFIANRILLPDLLSPTEYRLGHGSTDYLSQIGSDPEEKVYRKNRESLGTALGVDHTFLDQFDLVD